MLETIAQIASLISALSAVTTSLRALGKSREYSRYELESMIKSSARLPDFRANQPNSLRKRLLPYLAVTIIWYILSIVFAVLLLVLRRFDEKDFQLFLWVSLFLLLGFILWFIWRQIMFKRG